MTLQQYLTKINTLYITGNAREHSYRGDLQNLIMAIYKLYLVKKQQQKQQEETIPIPSLLVGDITIPTGTFK